MRLLVILTAAYLFAGLTFAQAETPSPGSAQASGSEIDTKKAAQAAPFPLQLEMRVPFEPTAFPSGPHIYLMYELHLTNYLPMPLSLARIEVLNGDSEDAQPIASNTDQRSGGPDLLWTTLPAAGLPHTTHTSGSEAPI